MTVDVTASVYPHVHLAFEAVSHDSGGGAGHAAYAVPAYLRPKLEAAERVLADLDDDCLVTVAIGDRDEAEAILGTYGEDGVQTEVLLELFFNDWEATP